MYCESWASEMAQLIKVLCCFTELLLYSGLQTTPWEERTHSHKLPSDLHMRVLACMHAHTHIHRPAHTHTNLFLIAYESSE